MRLEVFVKEELIPKARSLELAVMMWLIAMGYLSPSQCAARRFSFNEASRICSPLRPTIQAKMKDRAVTVDTPCVNLSSIWLPVLYSSKVLYRITPQRQIEQARDAMASKEVVVAKISGKNKTRRWANWTAAVPRARYRESGSVVETDQAHAMLPSKKILTWHATKIQNK